MGDDDEGLVLNIFSAPPPKPAPAQRPQKRGPDQISTSPAGRGQGRGTTPQHAQADRALPKAAGTRAAAPALSSQPPKRPSGTAAPPASAAVSRPRSGAGPTSGSGASSGSEPRPRSGADAAGPRSGPSGVGRGRGRAMGHVGVTAPAGGGSDVDRRDEAGGESPFASLMLASHAETFAAVPGLPAWVAQAVQKELGFARPTTVQLACCQAVLGEQQEDAGADVLVRAATGSGKTLAYLAPLVGRLVQLQAGAAGVRIERGQGTRILVLVPTRELAAQVEQVAVRLSRPFPWLVCGRLTGGEKRKAEKARLRKGLVLLVATPGRLLDHLEHTSALELRNCSALVLDEADRLLDLGFERDLRAILDHLGRRVQGPRLTMMCSATLRPELARFAQWALKARPRPLFIDADTLRLQPAARPVPIDLPQQEQQNQQDREQQSQEDQEQLPESADEFGEPQPVETETAASVASSGEFVVPPGLSQHYAVVPSRLRLVALAAFLRQQLDARAHVLVFVSTAASVEFFYALLPMVRVPLRPGKTQSKPKVPEEAGAEEPETVDTEETAVLERDAVWRLHGNLGQSERASAVRGFAGRPGGAVLVCTDVAARGLDLPRVRWVLQLDVPADPAEYVHRVGRTARLGARGASLLFLLPTERPYVDLLAARALRLGALDLVPALRVLNPTLRPPPTTDADEQAAFLEAAMAPLQARFERLVAADPVGLGGLARAAFKAFVRSYATHSREVRHVFHVRRLHLGHVAKSFALRDAPGKLKQLGAKLQGTNATKGAEPTRRRRHQPADEFADGIGAKRVKK